MSQEVLVVEDDDDIAALLIHSLEREGHAASRVSKGAAAIARVAINPPSLVVLDLGLPDIDGVDVCIELRSQGFEGGIIMVTARGGEMDRVEGLDVGADDYLPKPFSLAEFQARVRALLRRSAPTEEESVVVTRSGLRVDVATRRVFQETDEFTVTTKEFDVLALLASRLDKVVSRETLMDEVWDENWFGPTKTLDVTISRLRAKLESAGVLERVVSVRSVGFRLETPDEERLSC